MSSDVVIGRDAELAARGPALAIPRSGATTPRCGVPAPASTPRAEAFASQLKSQGYRFVGPTSVYAFMQNVGVVNDHIHGCFRATDYRRAREVSAPG
jgi:Methyladenine glycosylase